MDNRTKGMPQITRADVQQSLSVHSEALKVASKYYRKVLELSQASTEFANALEAVARCKGAEQSGRFSYDDFVGFYSFFTSPWIGIGLKAAAELHRLMAKHQEQLAEHINKDFELPLQRNMTAHQKKVEENDKLFDKSMRKMQDEISKTESKMMKSRKKDLDGFQQSLKDMQRQAEELEQLKYENYQRVFEDEQKNLMFFVQKAAGVVKNEYDHFSALAGLSRDVTEEIISIAFAPTGKSLDEAEKRRVVEKYLGGTSASATSTVQGSRDSFYSHADSRRDSQTSTLSSAGTGKPPLNPGSVASAVASLSVMTNQNNAAASTARPDTPPTTPLPVANAAQIQLPAPVVSSRASMSMNPTIQESLKRLNLAQQQAQSAQQLTPASSQNASPKTSRATTSDDLHQKPSSPAVADEKPAPMILPAKPVQDLVVGIHDFVARSDRELSFKKGDVMLVKQRQENWLYATHHAPGGVSTGGKSGWIPVIYTAKQQ